MEQKNFCATVSSIPCVQVQSILLLAPLLSTRGEGKLVYLLVKTHNMPLPFQSYNAQQRGPSRMVYQVYSTTASAQTLTYHHGMLSCTVVVAPNGMSATATTYLCMQYYSHPTHQDGNIYGIGTRSTAFLCATWRSRVSCWDGLVILNSHQAVSRTPACTPVAPPQMPTASPPSP